MPALRGALSVLTTAPAASAIVIDTLSFDTIFLPALSLTVLSLPVLR
jgi:hypothetical protein